MCGRETGNLNILQNRINKCESIRHTDVNAQWIGVLANIPNQTGIRQLIITAHKHKVRIQ